MGISAIGEYPCGSAGISRCFPEFPAALACASRQSQRCLGHKSEADGLYIFEWFVAEECIRTLAPKVCVKKQTKLD